MAATLLSSGTVLVDDELRQQAESVVSDARDRSLTGLLVSLGDGQQIEVGADVAQFFVGVLERLAHGPVSIMTLPDELTTTTAAEMLGMSRPTLMKLIVAKEIPATKVGSHNRLATNDVLAFKRMRDERRAAAFHSLRELDEEIGELREFSGK